MTISHYHYDHFNEHTSIYEGKKVFAKDIQNNINKSQHKRGIELKNQIENICDLEYCDDSTHHINTTTITFSPAFYLGPENIRLGHVIMKTITDNEKKVLHTSDAQGPVSTQSKEYIIHQNPDTLILDGPPKHMLGFRFSKKINLSIRKPH